MEDNDRRNRGNVQRGPQIPPTRRTVDEERQRMRNSSAGLRMPGSDVTVNSKVRERQIEEERRTKAEIQRREEQRRQEQWSEREQRGTQQREEQSGMKQRENKVSKKAMAYKRKIKRLWAVLGGEVVIFFLLLLGYTIFYANSKLNELDYTDIDAEELGINDGLEEMTDEYTTIALFGLDARDVTTDTGNRSDTIIIASINNKTKEVRLVSVYRDCYLELENPNGKCDDLYTKITHAYAYGGPKASIATLNKNLDLQITEYVTVNFASLTDVVNDLGGITVEVTEAERQSVNVFLPETAQIAGMSYTPVYSTGMVTLDGLQAVTYCRIRDVGNGDIERSERQREVLAAILDKAKQSDLATLNSILDDVLPEISTSLSKKQLLALMSNVFEYELTENQGFPFVYRMTTAYDEAAGMDLSVDIPANLENNVALLHEFLFDVRIEPIGGSAGATETGDAAGDATDGDLAAENSSNDTVSASGEEEDERDVYYPSDEVIRISNQIQNNTYTYPPDDPEFRGGFN